MSEWHYSFREKTHGPFSAEEIMTFFEKHEIDMTTPVWRAGMASWAMLKDVEFFKNLISAKKAGGASPSPKVATPATSATPVASVKLVTPVASGSPGPTDSQVEAMAKTSEEFGQEICPACGYFVGAATACPRCGAQMGRRISIRLIKAMSIIGAVVGIGMLWMAAHAKTPEKIKVGDIDEMTNGALVEIDGRITSYLEDAEKNSLKMKVNDGSGEIAVNAFNKLSQFKKELGSKMPKLGDNVAVSGSVNESQKFGISISLLLPERLQLVTRGEVKKLAVGDITKDRVGDLVMIRVHVTTYSQQTTKKGVVIHKFVLSDDSGDIPMTAFDGFMKALPEETKSLLTGKNRELELLIKVGEFQNKLQAEILDASSIKDMGPLHSAAVPAAPAAIDTDAAAPEEASPAPATAPAPAPTPASVPAPARGARR